MFSHSTLCVPSRLFSPSHLVFSFFLLSLMLLFSISPTLFLYHISCFLSSFPFSLPLLSALHAHFLLFFGLFPLWLYDGTVIEAHL